MLRDCSGDWTVSDASQLYDVDHWGNGYFSLSPTGTLLVHPERNANRSIDVYSLMRRLEDGGTELPVLLRFNGILKDRMDEIHDVFAAAIEEHAYQNNFACIYPIKVNQQRQVVEQIVESGLERSSGLEAGSKPELLAVMAMSRPDTP
ncbi:MAG: arginine decarboxylase, partial [Pirellulaceae bacterium]